MPRERIPQQVYEQARGMLDNGATLKQVAQEFGFGRSTACRIRKGIHAYGRQEMLRRRIVKRCAQCGHLVVQPCLACQLEGNHAKAG